VDDALGVGQRMFHARGYHAVGLAALTDALGVKPASFYKVFASKAHFFACILDRYSRTTLALEHILTPERAPVEALADLILRAAHTYARDPERRGCLVLEATRGSDDEESAIIARRAAEARRDQIRAFVARSHPAAAHAATDYIVSTMSGLSACAREGMSEARLSVVATAAASGLETILSKAAKA
jgi:TetR/AcrR family transcriptional repressor for divergent bdcA